MLFYVIMYDNVRVSKHTFVYTAISNKVVIVNSRYWNRKELWGSSSTINVLLLALILQNIECRFIVYCHGNTVTTFAGTSVLLIMTVPKVPFGSNIDN